MKPLLIAILLVVQAATQELSSTLHSTIYGAQIAYVDEAVVFTCVVNRSNSMAWTSEEYIGAGVRLSLSSAQGVGHTVTALGNAQTVAILVNTSTDTAVFVVSELRIRVRSTYPIASVQCVNSGTNAVTSTSFYLPDVAQVTCDRQSVCAGDSVTCICVTGNSTSLAWMSNGNRLLFMSSDPLLTRRNVSGSNGYAVLTESSIVNGIRVIMSNITVSASSNDPEIILTCENADRNMIEPIIIPTTRTENCLVSPTDQVATPTDPGNENASSSNSCAGPIAAAIVIAVIFIVLIIVVIPISIVITYQVTYKDFKAQLEEKDKKIQNLMEDKKELEGQVEALMKENNQLKREREAIGRDIEKKDKQMKAKDTELQQLKSSRAKEKGEEKEHIKRLQSQTKKKDEEISQLKKEIAKEEKEHIKQLQSQSPNSQIDIQPTDEAKKKDEEMSQLRKEIVTEKAESKKSMKRELQEVLKALKNKVNKDIDQVLRVGTNVDQENPLKAMRTTLESLKKTMEADIDAASSNLEQKMESNGQPGRSVQEQPHKGVGPQPPAPEPQRTSKIFPFNLQGLLSKN